MGTISNRDLNTLVDEYRTKIDEARNLGTKERREARTVRDTELNKLREEYDRVVAEAIKVLDAGRAVHEEAYSTVIKTVDAQRAEAVEAVNRSFLVADKGLTEEQAKVLNFMVVGSSWWNNYPEHCRIIIRAMPFENYEALRDFGDRQGWCGTYSEWLTDALKAQVFDLDLTEHARGEVEQVLRSHLRYNDSRQSVLEKVDLLVAAAVKKALAERDEAEKAEAPADATEATEDATQS